MSQPVSEPDLGSAVRTIQIINVALILGVIFFLGVVILLRFSGKNEFLDPEPLALSSKSLLSLTALVIGVMQLTASWIVPNLVLAQQRQILAGKMAESVKTPTEPTWPAWLGMYQTIRIMRMALIEGAAFFNVIAFFLEGKAIPLLFGLSAIALLGIGFPTLSRVESWIEDQQSLARLG